MLDRLRELGLPDGHYAVFGSGPLLVRGVIEQASDLDVLVRGPAWEAALAHGRRLRLDELGVDVVDAGGGVTLGREWGIGEFDVDDLIDTAELIDGLPFVRLEHVVAYKRIANRSKDRAHLTALAAAGDGGDAVTDGIVRPADPSDHDELLDVWYRASQEAHSFLPDQFFEGERREIAERWLPISETTVYETGGRVAGFISLIGNEVGAIFVDPDHQRRGIGRALMNLARASRPFLELSVFEANAAGRHFYDTYGFEYAARRWNDTVGHWELRMRIDGFE